MRILLINQYSGNKGDRAVLYAMCRILKSIYRDVELFQHQTRSYGTGTNTIRLKVSGLYHGGGIMIE